MIHKYRAWDKKWSEWLTNLYTDLDGKLYVGNKETMYGLAISVASNENIITMQSTGLFDSSELPKEIFDGDIVKLHHFVTKYDVYGGAYESENEITGVIRYGYPEGEIKIIGKVYTPRWYIETKSSTIAIELIAGLHEESFTVLGNIHQHPELLEEE